MLYDPKWSKQKDKTQVFTLESLISWLKQQPPEKTYCYTDGGNCLLSQYFRAHGVLGTVCNRKVGRHLLPPNFNAIAGGAGDFTGITYTPKNDANWQRQRIFGHALARAEEVLAG